MLVINDKVIARDKLCEQFGLEYANIEKKPEFEGLRTWIDMSNGGKKRYNAGFNIVTSFTIEDEETKMPLEIVYATRKSTNKDTKDPEYFPKRVSIQGEGMNLMGDLDLAVWLALHPMNMTSPLNKGLKPSIEFVDTRARAKKRINDIGQLGEAIVHAKSIKGEEMRILAKGLGLYGIENKEDEEVSADLQDFAMKNHVVYMEKKDKRLTMIEGQIEHFVDKGIFKLENVGQVRRWSWTTGERTGETIVDIINTVVNAKEALKNHIFNDINNYLFYLNNVSETMSARERAVQALNNIKDESGKSIGNELPEHLKKIGKGGNLPTDFNEAKDYIMAKTNKRASSAVIARLYKGVIDGSITDENVQEFLDEYVAEKIA